MFNLIDSIQQGAQISVCGVKHTVLTKTFYVTETEQQNWYAKFVMDDHSVLVVAPFDDFMYFGRIQNVFGIGDTFAETISFQNKTFNKQAEDYQIVKKLVFGSPLIAEGEVHYADYANDEDEYSIISLAVVSRTKERADIVARVITLDDIAW